MIILMSLVLMLHRAIKQIAAALVSSPAHLSCRGAFGMGFYARWWRCSNRMIPPSFAVPSGIKTRGLHVFLSSAHQNCLLASALSQ